MTTTRHGFTLAIAVACLVGGFYRDDDALHVLIITDDAAGSC
jgi:hypothetical protein